MTLDRVQPLKIEGIDTGGDSDDKYPTALNPQEDLVECAGIVVNDADNRDESTVISRSGDDLLFKDTHNPVAVTLSQLIEQGFARFTNSNVSAGTGWTSLGTIDVATNSAFTFHATIVGRDKTTGDASGWTLRGVCSRATGSVTVLSSVKEVLYETDTNWDVRVSGGSTTASIDVYPDAANTTEWRCLVHATNIGGMDTLGYTGFSRVGVYSSMGAAGVNGRKYVATDSPLAHWVDDGSAWRPIVDGVLGTKPPVASSFTIINSGTLTDNAGTLIAEASSSTVHNHRCFMLSQTGTTMYAELIFDMVAPQMYSTTCYPGGGVTFRESSTGKSASVVVVFEGASSGNALLGTVCIYKYSADNNRSANRSGAYRCLLPHNGFFALRLRRADTVFYCEFSRDLLNWKDLDSSNTYYISGGSGYFTTAPDQVGFETIADGTANAILVKHFKYGTL